MDTMADDETVTCCVCRKPIRGLVYQDTITGEPMDVNCWDRENEY